MLKLEERKKPIQNITLMAMIAAINIIFALVSAFFPLAGFFILLFLPLASALVGYSCQAKYLPVYILGTIGLSIAVTAWNFSNTLFYLMPAVCSGSLFGLLKKFGLPISYCLFFVAILNIGLTYLSIYLVDLIYEVNMIEFLFSLINVDLSESILMGIPSLVFVYSLAQAALSALVIAYVPIDFSPLIKRNDFIIKISYEICGLTSLIIIWSFAYIVPSISYLFLFISAYFFVYSASTIFTTKASNNLLYIIPSVLLILGFFAFAMLYQNLPSNLGLLSLSIPFSSAEIGVLVMNLLLRRKD